MRLTRNTTPDGKCKYALVRLDKIRKMGITDNLGGIENALKVLESAGVLEYGEPGSEDECFVLKLKDQHTGHALRAYVRDILNDLTPEKPDTQYAADIIDLALRADAHPSRKRPD